MNKELILVLYIEKLTPFLKHIFCSQKHFKENILLIDCNTPKYNTQTISWIFQHAKDMEIVLDQPSCQLLFSYYENDFHALHHILYQLSIIYPKQTLNRTHIKQLISDTSSHFHISDLLNALLIGDHKKSYRVLKKIKIDNVIKPITMLHAIQNITSNLIIFKRKTPNKKNTLALLLNKHKIQIIYRPSFVIALQRLNLKQLYQIITLILQIEILIQKNHPSTIWHNFKLLIWLFKDIE